MRHHSAAQPSAEPQRSGEPETESRPSFGPSHLGPPKPGHYANDALYLLAWQDYINHMVTQFTTGPKAGRRAGVLRTLLLTVPSPVVRRLGYLQSNGMWRPDLIRDLTDDDPETPGET